MICRLPGYNPLSNIVSLFRSSGQVWTTVRLKATKQVTIIIIIRSVSVMGNSRDYNLK
jgi:hypothetical protein